LATEPGSNGAGGPLGSILKGIVHAGEFVAAMLMAAMFGTFIIQILIRYSARFVGLREAVPLLDPIRYGWTLDFCLLMWIWIVFWGNALIVRERDHVTFDILYTWVNPKVRRWFVIVTGLAICIGLLWSVIPTWDKFYILRLKKTATLGHVFGDWLRMRDIYLIYIAFLVVVPLRYAWRAWTAIRGRVESDLHHYDEMAEAEGGSRQGASPE